MKVRWLEIYISISLQLQEFKENLLQPISYIQLSWTHPREIASLDEKQYKTSTMLNQVYLTYNFFSLNVHIRNQGKYQHLKRKSNT